MEHLLLLYMGYVLIFILENISIIYNVALQKTETEQSFHFTNMIDGFLSKENNLGGFFCMWYIPN